MALDDFKTDKQFEIGSVKSRKKIENLQISEDDWKLIIEVEPWVLSSISNRLKDNEIRAIVQTMDKMIETEKGWWNEDLGEETIEEIETYREEIVDEQLRD